MSGEISVVHLVWGPLGPQRLASFIESYARHPAGCDHRLVVLYNGFQGGLDRAPWQSQLREIEHEELVLPAPMLDLAAYRVAVDQLRSGSVCFLNSYSVIETDGWLERFASVLASPGVGLVGAAGSYESGWDTAPFRLRILRRGFDRFPNPHVRTNAFAMPLALLRDLHWPPPRRKAQAHRLESGKQGLTRQVLGRGRAALVVGRDGVAYPPERWRQSATFRSGDQANLLISDNRTRDYAEAGPALRATLERMAWGDAGHSPLPGPGSERNH